ncbi:hypothetical protein N431DRAFT_481821 [Stipitochalara longipes BDJ]|nr:hypothetical protein N431DRAFT_481821 [Stipitochalara longipes BDJ]
MQLTTSILAFAFSALASPTIVQRQITSVTPDFCTEAGYPDGDPYGEPYGTGWCAGLESELGACYTWASFPAAEDAPLINNLTYVFIPGTFECELYKTSNCTGDSYNAQDGDNDLSNSEFGPTSFNKEVNSWLCVAS